MELLTWSILAFVTVIYNLNQSLGFYNKNDVIRGESGIKVGIHERGILFKTFGIGSSREGSGRSSGVRIGESKSNITRYKTAVVTQASYTTVTPSYYTHAPQLSMFNNSNQNITYLKVGMVVPYKSFGVREYTKAVTSAISTLQRSTRGPRLEMFQRYDIHVLITMKELTPSPTGYSGEHHRGPSLMHRHEFGLFASHGDSLIARDFRYNVGGE